MALKEKIAAFKAGLAAKAQPELLAVISKTIADLVASGQVSRALKVGDRIPAFSLPDAADGTVSSDALLARGPLVLTFYRGVWCPYCNMELQALEEALPEIQARGANVLAISPQVAKYSQKSQRDNKTSFPIAIDHGNALAAEFGLRWVEPEDMLAVHAKFGTHLADVNGEPSGSLPLAARYIVGSDGVIVYADVNADWSVRPEPADMLPVLDELRVRQAA